MNGKQRYTKILLVCVAEALAVILTNTVSTYIVPIHHTTISYIVCGVVLAYLVVHLYDYLLKKRRARLRQELQELTDAALMRYNVRDRDHH